MTHVDLVAPQSRRIASGPSELLLDGKPTMPFAKPAGKQQGTARTPSHEDLVPRHPPRAGQPERRERSEVTSRVEDVGVRLQSAIQ